MKEGDLCGSVIHVLGEGSKKCGFPLPFGKFLQRKYAWMANGVICLPIVELTSVPIIIPHFGNGKSS